MASTPPTIEELLTAIAALTVKNQDLFATYEKWANAETLLLAGRANDPDSFSANGDKTPPLGYYPVTNVNGQTIYVPCLDRMRLDRRVSVRDFGATGDGTTDDTEALRAAINAMSLAGGGEVWFPLTIGSYLVATPGVIENGESRNRGIIKLRSGVSLRSDGAKVTLSGGRFDPPALFYHAYWEDQRIDNLVIEGLYLYGSGDTMLYDEYIDGDPAKGFGSQYSHAIYIMRGRNITVRNCKIENWFGDGVETGNVFVGGGPEAWLIENTHIYDCEFKDIYREGVMFTSARGCSVHHCWFHGDGYLVAGIDVERHSANEQVKAVHVHHNLFDFRDGVGPGAFDRKVANIRYRKAWSNGFFYDGYTDDKYDGFFGENVFESNTVYQGCADCFNAANARIRNNIFINTYEDLTGIGLVQNHCITVYNEGMDGITFDGVRSVEVTGNTIIHDMDGHGVRAYKCKDLVVENNDIRLTRLDGIRFDYSQGLIRGNRIEDAGRPGALAHGININGANGVVVISLNRITDTRLGTARGIQWGIVVADILDAPPVIIDNQSIGVIEDCFRPQTGEQANFSLVHGNGNVYDQVWHNRNSAIFGSGVGAQNVTISGGADAYKTLFFSNGGTQVGSVGVQPDGGLALAVFDPDTGVYKYSAMEARQDGVLQMINSQVQVTGTWDKPFAFIEHGLFLWADAEFNLRYKVGTPESDTDGSLLVTPAYTVGKTLTVDGNGDEAMVEVKSVTGKGRSLRLTEGTRLNAVAEGLDGGGFQLSIFDANGNYIATTFASYPFDKSTRMLAGPVHVAGTWDKPLVVGGANMWIDSGKLYINTSTPSSATDGTVVGAQS